MQLTKMSSCLVGGNSSMVASCCRSSFAHTMALRQPCRQPRVTMRAENDKGLDAGSSGDVDLESLFAKEVQKRGLDSFDAGDLPGKEATGSSGSTSTSKSPFTSATKTRPAADVNLGEGQRQRSIAMVNEGLEGLIPRATELLKLGGSVFLAFIPFILAISIMFGGIYMVFGDHFVHGGDKNYGRPPYYDPAELLSEPTADPYIPYR